MKKKGRPRPKREFNRKSPPYSTRLIDAVINNDLKYFFFCMGSGDDINKKDAGGGTALHWAASEGRVAMLVALLEAGADMQVMDDMERRPLDWARRNNRKQIVSLLLEEEERRPKAQKPQSASERRQARLKELKNPFQLKKKPGDPKAG